MFPGTIKIFKECVRHNQYVVTLHAAEEMDDDELSIFDVERAILNGKIIARQQDKDPEEWKYIVRGQTIEGAYIVIVTKIGATGKMVIITVFRDE